MHYVRVEHDNTIHTDTGDHLWSFLAAEGAGLHAWDPSLQFANTPHPTEPTHISIWNGQRAITPRHVDWMPMICQYPLGQTCLNASLTLSFGLTQSDVALWAGGSLIISGSSRPQPVFGIVPNYVGLGAAVDLTSRSFEGRVSTNHGIGSLAFVARWMRGGPENNFWLGGEIATEHGLPIVPFALPNFVITGGSSLQNPRPEFFFGLRWGATLMSYTPESAINR